MGKKTFCKVEVLTQLKKSGITRLKKEEGC